MKKETVVLKFIGKNLDPDAPSEAQLDLLNRLTKLPKGHVFSTPEVVKFTKLGDATFRQRLNRAGKSFEQYRMKVGKDWVWGLPESLTAYKNLLSERGLL